MSTDKSVRRQAMQRLGLLRNRLNQIKSSNYDVSATCNLTCEGCLYFAKDAVENAKPNADDAQWEALFKAEATRGINFVYLAGAEPSLVPKRVMAAARYIPQGVVFTNGTRKLPAELPYRLHISMWGLGETSAALRGADVNEKALRNYAHDPRAVFVFTITPENIADIVPAADLCKSNGVRLTFNYFSPTLAYGRYLAGEHAQDGSYFRRGDEDGARLHTQESFAVARQAISEAACKHPDTVRYSMHYNDWITQPMENILTFDAQGVAIDCGNRLTDWHRHYEASATLSTSKCCSPNIDCRECRGHAMGYATYFKSFNTFRKNPAQLELWLDGLESWADLFLTATPKQAAVAAS